MSKIGFAVSKGDADQPLDVPLAVHLGRARWLLMVEEEDGRIEMRHNDGRTGGWVAEAFTRAGCTDLVAVRLSDLAFGHLSEHGLRLWRGTPGTPVGLLLERLQAGGLEELSWGRHRGLEE